jgi:hypothetical protein
MLYAHQQAVKGGIDESNRQTVQEAFERQGHRTAG